MIVFHGKQLYFIDQVDVNCAVNVVAGRVAIKDEEGESVEAVRSLSVLQHGLC